LFIRNTAHDADLSLVGRGEDGPRAAEQNRPIKRTSDNAHTMPLV